MGQLVIAVYTPKPGKDRELVDLIREHLPMLWNEGLVTDRRPVLMRAANGTLLEVFEWASAAAVEAAHTNPAVLRLWERFESLCTYGTLGDLPEAHRPFPPFEPVDI